VPQRREKLKKNSKRKKRGGKFSPKSARRHIHSLPRPSAKLPAKSVGQLFEDFVAVQARLRAPGGCPWDREQDHLTLRTFLIEEAYEVLDAIEAGNPRELVEELGDLLLQVLFHADLAREAGSFDISDVITGIHNKMIRRHPHVFADVKAETSGEVLKNWAQLKAKEKQESSDLARFPQKIRSASVLDGVPRHLPALLEAYQLTRRAAGVGFDWDRVEGIFEKLQEETTELRSALATSDRAAVEEEVGDLFFSLVNLARFLKIDPEVALKHSNSKFKERFEEMESKTSDTNTQLSQLSKEELEQLWVAAKSKARNPSSKKADS
jgi:tetrapyrrole methylase family protein / MazG family protein